MCAAIAGWPGKKSGHHVTRKEKNGCRKGTEGVNLFCLKGNIAPLTLPRGSFQGEEGEIAPFGDGEGNIPGKAFR